MGRFQRPPGRAWCVQFSALVMKVGLCGWTIGMREYFERFPVVEVQQTFYHPPALRTLLRWREAAPDGFEFTLKAWQLITHRASSRTYRRFKGTLTDSEKADCGAFQWTDVVRNAWNTTAECAHVLRASSVLFQCPASFRPIDENVANMRLFFGNAERHGLRFLWEPRGPWPAELVLSLCRELGLVHVVDPFVNASVTPELLYYRLHGITGARHVYTDDELRRLADLVPPTGEAYVLFNEMARSEDSDRFLRLMARRESGRR
jgi:uncharacterized protein YecE (DUF72 family)